MAQFSRLRRRVEEHPELNMVPIMNMFMVLIPFLLMSASFYHIKAINTSVPVHADTGSQSTSDKGPVKITVVLELKQDQIRISALSSSVDEKALSDVETTLTRPPGGEISVVELADYLQKLKDQYPASDTMLLIPDDTVSYREIIQAMDCARRQDTEALFPNVVLSGSLG